MKGNKGITLIALVITIIVLLILAGVSIAMLTGENSILKRASQASAQNQLGAANDAVSLLVADKTAEFYEVSYVGLNGAAPATDTLKKGLDDYLAKNVTDSACSTEISNNNIKNGVNAKNGNPTIHVTKTTVETNKEKITSIELRISDNTGTWKSTGTVTNGKVTWSIGKEQ